MRKLLIIPIIALTMVACSSSGATKGAPRPDRSLLTAEEIGRAGLTDALNAVRALRPHWLSRRGPSSINLQESVKVYLDGNLMGGPEFLGQISTHSIASIKHMDGLEATQRYGLDHGQGAILVFTRRD